MNSVALILALILFLSPGLGVFAGFYTLSGNSQFKASPPRPGSIVALTIIIFGAIIAHAIAAVLFELLSSDVLGFVLLEWPHNPNPYGLITELVSNESDVSNYEVVYVLAWMAIIPVTATLISWFTGSQLLPNKRISSFVYGWIEQIVREAAPEDNWVVAFALTQATMGGSILGYEGTVKEITLDPDKSIKSITLIDVERFLVTRSSNTFRRKTPLENVPKIGTLHIPATRIENVAFTIFAVEDE